MQPTEYHYQPGKQVSPATKSSCPTDFQVSLSGFDPNPRLRFLVEPIFATVLVQLRENRCGDRACARISCRFVIIIGWWNFKKMNFFYIVSYVDKG